MPLNPEHRSQYLLYLARDCTVADLKTLRSDIEAELARRISAKLVALLPGQHVRFVTDLTKAGEIAKWDVGTLLRIHRRSMIVQGLNGKELNVNGERFIEVVGDAEWERLRSQQNLGPAATAAQTAIDEAEAARVSQAPPNELFAGIGELGPDSFPGEDFPAVELPDSVV